MKSTSLCRVRKKKLDFFLVTLLCYLLYGTPVTDKYNRHSLPRIVLNEAPRAPRLYTFFQPAFTTLPPPLYTFYPLRCVRDPPPTHWIFFFFVSPLPPLAPPPTRQKLRKLSFLLFAFFGIFPVAPGIVSRFVIVIHDRACILVT